MLSAWYCMRGDRPMSPKTTICTVRPCFHFNGSFPSASTFSTAFPSSSTNLSGLSVYGSYCLGNVTSSTVKRVDNPTMTPSTSEKPLLNFSVNKSSPNMVHA
jgi:hypothetical protein